jgi:hypothetical protein
MSAIKSLYNKILLNDIDKKTAEIIIGKEVKNWADIKEQKTIQETE